MAVHTDLSSEEAADRVALRELFDVYAHCADRRDAEGQEALFTDDTRFVVFMDGEGTEATYVVERLVHAAYCDPERGSRWVRKVMVRAALDGGGSWELPVAFREALADPQDAWSSIKGAILRKPPERPVEELEVELVGLSAESGKQAAMFEGKGKLWRQVQEAVRQLGTQREAPSVGKVVALDPRSRIPERRSALAEIESDV